LALQRRDRHWPRIVPRDVAAMRTEAVPHVGLVADHFEMVRDAFAADLHPAIDLSFGAGEFEYTQTCSELLLLQIKEAWK